MTYRAGRVVAAGASQAGRSRQTHFSLEEIKRPMTVPRLPPACPYVPVRLSPVFHIRLSRSDIHCYLFCFVFCFFLFYFFFFCLSTSCETDLLFSHLRLTSFLDCLCSVTADELVYSGETTTNGLVCLSAQSRFSASPKEESFANWELRIILIPRGEMTEKMTKTYIICIRRPQGGGQYRTITCPPMQDKKN